MTASAVTDVERPNALGAVHLVSANRQQVNIPCINADGNFSYRLCSIGVHNCTMCVGDRR